MKVKVYNSSKYQKTTVYDVERIEAMPDTEEFNEDRELWMEYPEGILLHLFMKDERDLFVPHSLLISIEE